MRILIAGVLGAIGMFIWLSIAHMATPLAMIGVSHLNHEQPVMDAIRADLDSQSGFYLTPWNEDMSPEAMKAHQAKLDANGMNLIVYRAPGTVSASMGKQLVFEFANELVQALIAAWLLSQAAIAGYARRALFVTAIGVAAGISTNISYEVWYGFPANYTHANILMTVVGYLVAGLVIAGVLRRNT